MSTLINALRQCNAGDIAAMAMIFVATFGFWLVTP